MGDVAVTVHARKVRARSLRVHRTALRVQLATYQCGSRINHQGGAKSATHLAQRESAPAGTHPGAQHALTKLSSCHQLQRSTMGTARPNDRKGGAIPPVRRTNASR